MIQECTFAVTQNRPIAKDVYEITLSGDTSAFKHPGQFANVKLDGLFLRRPISVCTWDDKNMKMIYKVTGKGTDFMSNLQPGDTLDMLTGLGNGFSVFPAKGRRIAVVGGGVGVPPLYGLMQQLSGEDVTCVLGFNTSADVFYAEEFEKLGARVLVTTVDGSMGIRGFVTDALKHIDYDYYFACGPTPMLKAVHALQKEGQLSLEARMGCGFGICMSCSCQMQTGMKRICLEGPVFTSQEVKL